MVLIRLRPCWKAVLNILLNSFLDSVQFNCKVNGDRFFTFSVSAIVGGE